MTPCTGASLHLQGTAQRHGVAVITTTSIHRPPHGDHPAVPAHAGTKPSSKGSVALPKWQQLPAWLSTTPDNKDDS